MPEIEKTLEERVNELEKRTYQLENENFKLKQKQDTKIFGSWDGYLKFVTLVLAIGFLRGKPF